jgi:putative ABC transport system substrate-binding protein
MASYIERRKFLATLLGGAVAGWRLAAFGQASDKRPRRIGYISASCPTSAAQNLAAFLEGMRAHGYIEGRDIEIDYRWGEGHIERLPALAEELVRSKIDLILASTVQATVAASNATKSIPIDRLSIACRSRALGPDQERRAAGRRRDGAVGMGGGASWKTS